MAKNIELLKRGDKFRMEFGSSTCKAKVVNNLPEEQLLAVRIKFGEFMFYTSAIYIFKYTDSNLQFYKLLNK